MTIIIGLGNPGKEFEHTPHNIGFEALDAFVKKNDLPDFSEEKKLLAQVSKKGALVLAKPTTFMNDSGKAAKKLWLLYKSKNPMVVIHDDKDIPLGSLKIVKNRGSAGHKGVESVIAAVGNKNIIRIRMGTATKKKTDAMATVLKKFSKDQLLLEKKSVKKAAEALDCLLSDGPDQAMNIYNR